MHITITKELVRIQLTKEKFKDVTALLNQLALNEITTVR